MSKAKLKFGYACCTGSTPYAFERTANTVGHEKVKDTGISDPPKADAKEEGNAEKSPKKLPKKSLNPVYLT